MADGITSAPETGAAGPSLRDTLATSLKESQEGTLQVPDLPVAGETPPDKTAEPARTDGRARGPDGKFIAKEASETVSDTSLAAQPDKTEPAAEPAKAEPAPVAASTVEAPTNWSQADKDMLAKAPPDMQKWALERYRATEADYTKKTQAIAPLATVADRAKGYLDSIGAAPDQAFHALLTTEYTLRRGNDQEFAVAMQKLCDQYRPGYKITPPSPAPGTTVTPAEQTGQDEWEDPQVTALRAEVRAAKEDAQRALQLQTAQLQSRHMTEIDSFEAEKDASGNAAHPHFSAVLPEIVRLAEIERQAGRIPNLKSLYETAVYMNPTVRAQLLDQERAEQQRKRDADQKAAEEATRKKAEDAKRAASSVTGGPRGGTTEVVAPKGSVRADLERSRQEHMGRL